MKKLIFIILTIAPSMIDCAPITTSDWAQKLGYFKTYEAAQNKAWGFLGALDDKFNRKLKTLNDSGHHNTANSLQTDYLNKRKKWESLFDDKFEKIDRNLTMKGYELDEFNAPFEQKKFLIRESIKQLNAVLSEEIKNTMSHFLRQTE